MVIANYESIVRSNYFRVKDYKKYEDWCGKVGLQTMDRGDGMYGFFTYDGLPSYYWDEDDNEIEIDFDEELSKHLVEGEVAIHMEVGNEKLRYLDGNATAVRYDGAWLFISLRDIYTKVEKEWNRNPKNESKWILEPTEASY